MSNKMTFGYVRVSSKDQNEARQMKQMKDQGIQDRNIFIDKESGYTFNRDQYRAMLGVMRPGDTLMVASIDRLGRNYEEILEQWKHLVDNLKVDIVVLDMPLLDTREGRDLTGKLISDIVLQLLSYVAEREREYLRKRQAEGIELAKAKGLYAGRKPIEVDRDMFASYQGEVDRGERMHKWVMAQMDLKQATYYKILKEYREGTGRFEGYVK